MRYSWLLLFLITVSPLFAATGFTGATGDACPGPISLGKIYEGRDGSATALNPGNLIIPGKWLNQLAADVQVLYDAGGVQGITGVTGVTGLLE